MKRLIGVAFLVLAHPSSMAEHSPKGVRPPPIAKSAPHGKANMADRFDRDPFDVESTALPPGYQGHNCVEVSNKLNGLKPEKDEFETSQDYSERVERIRLTPLYASVTAASTLAFSKEISTSRVDYDADSESMNVSIFPSKATMVGEKFFESAVIDRQVESRSEYVGVNAYGRKVNVARTRYLVCAATFNNIDTISRKIRTPNSLAFKINPSDARVAKDNLGLLYILNTAPPFVVKYHEYAAPTIDSPTELSFGGNVIVGRLQQMWLYNIKTGQIYAKELIPTY